MGMNRVIMRPPGQTVGRDAVEARGGAAQDGGSVGGRELVEQEAQLLPHAHVAACQHRDRPVAAEHQAVRAKQLEGQFEVGPDVVRGPGREVAHGGVEPRHLRVHAGILGGARDEAPPRLVARGLDGRLGQVVDDHPQVRVAFRQGRDVLKMPRQDGDDIERDIVRGQDIQRRAHVRPEEPVRVGLRVDEVADAGEGRVGAQDGQPLCDRGRIVERHPSDDRGDLRVARRDLEHVGRVGGVVRRLDEHRALHARRREQWRQLRELDGAVDGPEVRAEPVVRGPGRIPEMLVRVDDGQDVRPPSGKSFFQGRQPGHGVNSPGVTPGRRSPGAGRPGRAARARSRRRQSPGELRRARIRRP